MYNIIQKRKIWFAISGSLVVASLLFLVIWGLKLGIDFTGGSLLEVRYPQKAPSVEAVKTALSGLDIHSLTVQPASEKGLILRFQDTAEATHQKIIDRLNSLIPKQKEVKKDQDNQIKLDIKDNKNSDIKVNTVNTNDKVDELRFEAVGPSIGRELKHKTIYAIIIVLLAIIFYVAWSFRKVSKPIASWKYGLVAIIALFHDVLIVVGIFVVLGKFFGVEVNVSFVAALLTVLGYSVNDTIVVFDRVRENLPKSDLDFEGTVNISVNQSIARSLNTSITSMLVLLAIAILGGASIRYFALALFFGVFVGTYSSIFIASPLVVWLEKIKK